MSTEKSSAKEEIRFNVRISPDLHERITRRAKANARSMNSEIINILQSVIDDPEGHRANDLRQMLEAAEAELKHTKAILLALKVRSEAIRCELNALEQSHPPPG